MSETYMLYSSFADKGEAISAARTLLKEKLVACVNIFDNATSLYFWQEEMLEESEVIFVAKTGAARLQEAMARLKTLHSYKIPCILAYPAADGYAPYIQWVKTQTA